MSNVIQIERLNKTYDSGFTALRDVNLSIRKGEIFALLGPNGAGKTTLISIVCGIVNASSGTVLADDPSLTARGDGGELLQGNRVIKVFRRFAVNRKSKEVG